MTYAFGAYAYDCWDDRDGSAAAEIGRWLWAVPASHKFKRGLTPEEVASWLPTEVTPQDLDAAATEWREECRRVEEGWRRAARAWEQYRGREPRDWTWDGVDPLITHAATRSAWALLCVGWDGDSWRHVAKHDWYDLDLLWMPRRTVPVRFEVVFDDDGSDDLL
jgi:hypothetical protein